MNHNPNMSWPGPPNRAKRGRRVNFTTRRSMGGHAPPNHKKGRWGWTAGFHRPGARRPRYDRERAAKILHERLVVSSQDVAPPDHHHIHVGRRVLGGCHLYRRPEAALDPVALGRIADLLGHRQPVSQAEAVAVVPGAAQPTLHGHPLRTKAAARGRRKKVRSLRQPSDHARGCRGSGAIESRPTSACGRERGGPR